MQSSFNVIKNSRVIEQGNREITTQLREVSGGVVGNPIISESYAMKKANMESYENIARNILDNARQESEKIISKAYVDAMETKTQALNEGLEQGYSEGYEKGYNEAMTQVMAEAEEIRAKANSILVAAKEEYNKYLIDKEQHIKDLVVNITESILKREVKEPDALNEMIFNVLKTERNIKSYIIKVNSTHFATITDEIKNFKNKLAFQGDIFVIEDNFLDEGTAIIEKESGKNIVSIAYGIEKIIKVFQEEQIQI
jgi:flagellar assembly protein FliH